jgi:hypothetical protein
MPGIINMLGFRHVIYCTTINYLIMKNFEITKEQILDLSKENNNHLVKAQLKAWFPQAFQTVLEVGKWYKSEIQNDLLFFNKEETQFGYIGYAINNNGWEDNYQIMYRLDALYLATDQEVETALIAEAKRRYSLECGITLYFEFDEVPYSSTYFNSKLGFEYKNNTLFFCGGILFKDGKWAKIIYRPIEVTLEEIAEKFGVNVEQIKIKK